MKFYSVVSTLLLWILLSFEKCESLDLDINRNVTELISTKGYPVEEYEVQTADGYILSLQRIPHGIYQQKNSNCKSEVIFLMHGLSCDSSSWVANFPEQSLGFTLADKGHDVWLGNSRGNTYSKKHIKLTPDMKEFWDFSLDELAEFDLPAMIDFVLNKTKAEQLVFIGTSEGTTIMFALLSQSQEYNQKVKIFFAPAPVTTFQNLTSVIRYLIPFANEIAFTLKLLGIHHLATPSLIEKYLRTGACNAELKFLCKITLFEVFGYDPQQLNETRLSVYSTLFLSGSSVRNFLHFAQVKRANRFQKYDYGLIGNMRRYNQVTPPIYDITKITTPVVLMYGMNDKIADPRDVHELEGLIPNLVTSYSVPYKAFNHYDFFLAMDAYKLVNEKIIKLLCCLH